MAEKWGRNRKRENLRGGGVEENGGLGNPAGQWGGRDAHDTVSFELSSDARESYFFSWVCLDLF